MRYLVLTGLLLASVGCSGDSESPRAPVGVLESSSLSELCSEYPTDKCAHHHDYVDLYGTLFAPLRDEGVRIMEIGVLEGDSMRMWEAYFPNGEIYGLDIVDTSVHDTDRITTFIADQSDRDQLGGFIDAYGSDFDIVIDDGGHTMEQQQTSFGYLFPHVRSGGIYVIEDVHTSFPDKYPGYGVEGDGENSTFAMIERFVRNGVFDSPYLTENELKYLSSEVDHCLYSYRPSEFQSDFFLCYKK